MPNLETTDRYQVRSVARALEMLEAVGESGEAGLTLTEMAQRLDMAKSSTMAAARTLASFGFLRIETPGPRYHLGLALLRYLPQWPLEWGGLALALAGWRRARRGQRDPCELALLAIGAATLLCLAALLETYAVPQA